MQPDTRQTLIGVLGMTIVMAVALSEGYNGKVTVAYFVAVLMQTAPQALQEVGFPF